MNVKNVLAVVVVLFLFVISAYLIYTYGMSIESHNESISPEEVYFNFLGSNIENNYSLVYEINDDGINNTITLIKSGPNRYYKISNVIFNKEIFYLNDSKIVCVQYPSNNKKVCANVLNLGSLKSFVKSKEDYFPSKEGRISKKESDEFMLNKSALVFSNDVENKSVNGFQCEEVHFDLSFSKLSLDDLYKLGYSTNIYTIKNYSSDLCFGDNLKVFEKSNYTIGSNHGVVSKFQIKKLISKGPGVDISLPNSYLFVNESELVSILSYSDNAVKEVYTCMFDKHPEYCFEEDAIDNNLLFYCEFAGNERDKCFTISGSKWVDINRCNMINNVSFRDDCILDVSVSLKNQTMCNNISNQTKFADCIDLSSTSEQNSTNETNSTE